jgi:hypothetical protein
LKRDKIYPILFYIKSNKIKLTTLIKNFLYYNQNK